MNKFITLGLDVEEIKNLVRKIFRENEILSNEEFFNKIAQAIAENIDKILKEIK